MGFQGVTRHRVSDTSQGRPYAYLPIAAGGTSFPYQIRYRRASRCENLRLSGQTLAKIFTNQITNWDDPEITKDNNGVQLPSLPIIPVVQSEGSGSTQQLTHYFATEYPSIWTPFAGVAGPTEYFPRQGDQIAQNGSDGAMNYVSSSAANGSIGYVEYSFALSVELPGGQGAQQRWLLHAADAVQRRGRARGGADQHGQELTELPAAEPRPTSTPTRTRGPTRSRRTST